MQSKTIHAKSVEEIAALLELTITADFIPVLAVVFTDLLNDTPALCALLEKKGIAIFGASSNGQFIQKEYDTGSVAIMLLDAQRANFAILFEETNGRSTKETAIAIAHGAKNVFDRPALIIASGGIRADGERIVEGIQQELGKDAPIFGGLAASDLSIMRPFVFTNNRLSDDGMVALVLNNDHISVEGHATGGSQPVGIFHTITSSRENIVYTIDGEPALDILLRYSGKKKDALSSGEELLGNVSSIQIQLHRDHASPVMRTPMFGNLDDKSVVFAGGLPQGSRVKFSILPGFEVVGNTIAEFKELRKEVKDADAMILFSCKGREIAFGPWMGDEIQGIRELWPAPMIGFFCFGEIGCNAEKKYDFFNITCSLALITERSLS